VYPIWLVAVLFLAGGCIGLAIGVLLVCLRERGKSEDGPHR
jgi:hypothetical protein